MRKMLLLAATLGAVALIPAAASADGHDAARRHVATSLAFEIIVHDTPKVVHRHHLKRHLRPRPWFRHFHHHAPRRAWHKPAPRRGWHGPGPWPWHFDRHGQRGSWPFPGLHRRKRRASTEQDSTPARRIRCGRR